MSERCVILAGAGASRNSWDYVLRGIQKAMPDKEITQDNAEFVFANLVQMVRWINNSILLNEKVQKNDKLLAAFKIKANELNTLLLEVKYSIAEELNLATAEKKIYLDSNILSRIQYDIIKESQPVLITTNWDLLFEEYFDLDSILYLHGSVRDPSSMFLPSETIEESYRTQQERTKHGFLVGQFVHELPKADKIIIYGLGFNSLDAELGVAWSESFWGVEKLPNVYVVDPKPDNIIKKLKYLTPNLKIEAVLTDCYKGFVSCKQ